LSRFSFRSRCASSKLSFCSSKSALSCTSRDCCSCKAQRARGTAQHSTKASLSPPA
jgi:hypothetical protein